MLIIRKNGATSNTLRVMLRNSSTGAGLTGLTNASSGLIISTIADNEASATVYTVAGSTIESIATLGTFATPTATKCRFKEVDATNHPGLYEIQLADARFAVSSAKVLRVCISGATNLLTKDVTIQLDSLDLDSATVTVGTNNDKTGYSLSQAFPTNFSALAITAGGIVQADLQTIKTQTVTCAGGVTVPAATLASTSNITTVGAVSGAVGSVTGAVGSVTGNVGGNVTGSVGSISGVSFPTNFGTFSIDTSGRVLLQPTQTGVTIPTVTNTGTLAGVATVVLTDGSLTAAKIGADAFTAAKFAADVTTEFQNGLATASALSALVALIGTSGNAATIGGAIDVAVSEANSAHNIVASATYGNPSLLTAISALGSPAQAGDAMTLTTAYDAAKSAASQTSVNAVKTQTDKLTFDVSNNVKSSPQTSISIDVNAVAVAVRDVSNASPAAGSLGEVINQTKDIVAALDTGTGSGLHAVTITVTDGTDPIQSANVELRINASRYQDTTDANGIVVLNPNENDGTYEVRITAAGYQFTPVDLVVSGDTPHTYAMTPITITPSSPSKVTGYITTEDLAANVVFNLKYDTPPSTGAGVAFNAPIQSATSNGSGLAEFTDLVVGVSYFVCKVKADGTRGPWEKFTAADSGDPAGTMKLPYCSG